MPKNECPLCKSALPVNLEGMKWVNVYIMDSIGLESFKRVCITQQVYDELLIACALGKDRAPMLVVGEQHETLR